jgi:hypothetical protein
MMKNQSMLRGSGAGLAAIIKVDTTVGFLENRKQFVSLSPSETHPSTYIWRRIFLRARRG